MKVNMSEEELYDINFGDIHQRLLFWLNVKIKLLICPKSENILN